MAVTQEQTVGLMSGGRREAEDAWRLCRTLRGGTAEMRRAGALYTPASKREQRVPERYHARMMRSVLLPMYDRTVRKIAALPFQKPPTVTGEMPDSVDRIIKNADRQGTSLASFAQMIYQDGVDRGQGLFLVDHVEMPAGGLPLTESDDVDARPYFCRIEPDNVLGWETEVRYGIEVVTNFRYREWFYRPSTTGVGDVLCERVREWDEAKVRIWEQDTATTTNPDRVALPGTNHGAKSFRLVKTIAHGFGCVPLIDFYTKKVSKLHSSPPLEDLAWINVSHWNSLSMQNEALHYCRSPILKITGVSHETAESKPETGPGSTITDSGENVDVSFVEIAGSSLAAGQVQIDKLERMAEALGMQPLLAVAGPETATGEVRADQNEKSEAQVWIEALEWAIWRGLNLAAKHAGETMPEDADWTLFRDSSLIQGKATDAPLLMTAAEKGFVTRLTLIREFAARGILATVEDPEAEDAAVQGEADAKAERQMEALALQMKNQRPENQPPQDGDEPAGAAA